MRRKAILVVLAIVLVLGGIGGGIAYAIDNGHQPNYGNKLVGIGSYGFSEDPIKGTFEFGAHFGITNPDCVHSIKITRIALLDSAGDVVWEESPIDLPEPLPEYLSPHQSVKISLQPAPGAGEPALDTYTVEIAWKAKKGTSPLMGVVSEYVGMLGEGGTLVALVYSATPMVNFVQKH